MAILYAIEITICNVVECVSVYTTHDTCTAKSVCVHWGSDCDCARRDVCTTKSVCTVYTTHDTTRALRFSLIRLSLDMAVSFTVSWRMTPCRNPDPPPYYILLHKRIERRDRTHNVAHTQWCTAGGAL